MCVAGVGSSFGSLIFVAGVYLAYKFIRKQRKLNQKKKFFKRNGGLLLQQQLTSTQGNIETTKVFTSKELEKATENFSLNRILGQGGQGTVYKGMLVDGRIVAVKKSKVVERGQVGRVYQRSCHSFADQPQEHRETLGMLPRDTCPGSRHYKKKWY